MVELQRAFEDRDNSIAVYAISYDSVETLARFADRHGVTYPLLADVGSLVIGRLGLLNVTLEQERAAYGQPVEDRHRGIPYPGTFLLDEDGVVIEKRFEQSHRIRPTGETLLRRLVGESGVAPKLMTEAGAPGVHLAVWLDAEVLYANQLQELHLRIELDDDVHLYTRPVPVGFRALDVRLSGDERLRADPIEVSGGTEFTIAGLEETFNVLEGQIDLDLPFILLSNRDTAGDGSREVQLHVEVDFQACTAQECFMPERIELKLTLSEEPNPGYETNDPAALVPLVLRRIVEQPRTTDELFVLVNAALEGVEVSGPLLGEVLQEMCADEVIVSDPDGTWRQSDLV